MDIIALLRPQTVRIAGRRGAGMVIRVEGGMLRKSGAAELVLIAGHRGLKRALNKAAAGARAVVVLPRQDHQEVIPPASREVPVLGPGSGIWSPVVQAGVAAPGHTAQQRRGCLLVTRSRALAAQLVGVAAARGLCIEGVVCTGCDRPVSWVDVAVAAAELDPSPVVIAAPGPPATIDDLGRLAGVQAEMVLLAGPGSATSQRSMARALGLTVTRSACEAAEVAFLLGCGVRRGGATVQLVAADEDQAEVLRQAAAGAGVELEGCTVLAGKRGRPGHRGAGRLDCLLYGPGVDLVRRQAAVELQWDGGFLPGPAQAVDSTLAALATLQAPALPAPGTALRRPRVSVARARRLLDGWGSLLDELQVKELLDCYGLKGPAESLASSSSGASRMAREIGFPVAVKPVGPQLRDRRSRGAVALGVGNESGVRQAFREVVNACAAMVPPPLLEGVLVSAMAEVPWFLDCSLIWPDHGPPLLSVEPRAGHLRLAPVMLACPAPEGHCQQAAARLLQRSQVSPNKSLLVRLSRFLWRLTWLGLDLVGRMRWLRLDTVSPPTSRTSPLVLDGYGEQTEGMRAPAY